MRRMLAPVLVLGLLAMSAFFQKAHALDPDWDLLNQGEVQTSIEPFESHDGIRKRAVAMVVLPANIEMAWKILNDRESKGEYVPSLRNYRTVYLSDSEKFVAGRLRILWMNINYPLWIQFDSNRNKHTWRMLRDEELPEVENRGIKGLLPAHFAIENIEGYWKVSPLDGNRTLLFYSLLIRTRIPIPNAVEAHLAKMTLPDFMTALRQRVIYKGETWEPNKPQPQ